jgi:nitrous oxide reductase
MAEIDRRSFLGAAAVSAAAVAGASGAGCQREAEPPPAPPPFLTAMRAVEIPDGVAAAIVFQPLKQPT